MQLVALKHIKAETPNGLVEIHPGVVFDVFDPTDTKPFLDAGVAIPVTPDLFKRTFKKFLDHARQRDYTQEDIAKLMKLSFKMDDAWEALDYAAFKKVIDKMMSIPGTFRSEGGKPIAARIHSTILGEDVWVISDRSAIPLIPAGATYYMPEEIRRLKGATPEEIQAVHKVKKELGGELVDVREKEEKDKKVA